MRKKVIKELPNVFNCSGGKTSAYMVLKYYKPGDIVLFTDTGREHDKTYKFLNDFEAHEGIPIIRISFNTELKRELENERWWLREFKAGRIIAEGDDILDRLLKIQKLKDKIKEFENLSPFSSLLKKKKYKVIPNRVKRICTRELKVNTAKKYLKTLGVLTFKNFIGFRADEPLRVSRRKQEFKKVIDCFPLYDDGTTKATVNEFWLNKSRGFDTLKNKPCFPYTLEIPSILGNCTLCFMKGPSAIIAILTVYPELAAPWIEDEESSAKVAKAEGQKNGSGRRYFPDLTMQQLLNIAKNNLFSNKISLDELASAFNCACGP